MSSIRPPAGADGKSGQRSASQKHGTCGSDLPLHYRVTQPFHGLCMGAPVLFMWASGAAYAVHDNPECLSVILISLPGVGEIVRSPPPRNGSRDAQHPSAQTPIIKRTGEEACCTARAWARVQTYRGRVAGRKGQFEKADPGSAKPITSGWLRARRFVGWVHLKNAGLCKQSWAGIGSKG
ncbi:hypothetical protein VTI74DRAFT_683 [Chaetomium olivicolor]